MILDALVLNCIADLILLPPTAQHIHSFPFKGNNNLLNMSQKEWLGFLLHRHSYEAAT